MDAAEMVAVLRDGTPEERRRFVAGLPENPFKDMTLMLMHDDPPDSAVVALGSMIVQYCSGSDPQTGATLALATHTLGLEIYESGRRHCLLPSTLSSLAYHHVNALGLLGRSEDVLAFTERFIPYYERLGERQNVASLKTARLGALVNLGRLDEAERLLADPTMHGNPAADVEIYRLEGKVRGMKEDRRSPGG